MRREERIIYFLLVFAGGLPLVGAIADHKPFGAGITISVVLVALGVAGLVRSVTR